MTKYAKYGIIKIVIQNICAMTTDGIRAHGLVIPAKMGCITTNENYTNEVIYMDFATIMKYLEQGFTLEQIEQMRTANEKNTAGKPAGGAASDTAPAADTAPASDPAPASDAAPAWVEGLSKSIEKLTMTMQAQALANTSISAPKDIQTQADEILANIINPTKTKE